MPLFAALFSIISTIGCVTGTPVASPVYFPAPPAQPRVVHLISFNRLHDLVPPRVGWRHLYRGASLSPSVGVPAGVDYRDDTLYVCDTAQNAVHKWNLRTGDASVIGVGGDGGLSKPVDVAVDARGTVYVADSERQGIVVFDHEGKYIRQLVPPDRDRYRPVALAVQDQTLYTVDVIAHIVDRYATGGTHLAADGGPGTEPGKFYYPTGIATTPSGNLIVADMMNGRVQVLDASCRPIRRMGRPGNRYGDLGKPKHVAVGPDDVLFVADAEFARVQMFRTDGRFLMLLGGDQDAPGGTLMPIGVAVAESLPEAVASLVPPEFRVQYYLFATNTIGSRRISLFAVGQGHGKLLDSPD